MKAALYRYRNGSIERHPNSDEFDDKLAQLALCFGSKKLLASDGFYDILREKLPQTDIAMCSTAGELYDTEVSDDTVTVATIFLERSRVIAHSINLNGHANSYEAGIALRHLFESEELTYLLVLSDGSKVNGSDLVKGLNAFGHPLLITGGLAGDGGEFISTVAGLNAQPTEGTIVGVGFYGTHLKIGHGSQGGWEMFGMEKKVTRSEGNVLYELDGKNALELYKKYLGPEADALPGSALLFPLSVSVPGTNDQLVRTILSIDHEKGSMTFAGDIPEGAQVRLMKANFDKITNAASKAALRVRTNEKNAPRLALLISCVGRKLILKKRTDEEVEAVRSVFGNDTLLAGFYSYGEISPLVQGEPSVLHNQTMTITTIDERE